MKSIAATSLAIFIGCILSCSNYEEAERVLPVNAQESILSGQVLLPNGFSRRGLELHLNLIAPDGKLVDKWLLFDKQGHFSYVIEGSLTSVIISAGLRAEIFKIKSAELPKINREGQIDLGVIDLRDKLKVHRLMVRAAEGKPQGEVRVAMWFKPPPVGPSGGRVELGSRQFPPITLGHEQEWLLPLQADEIYFLVERPIDLEGASGWRSGHQRLFGPYTLAELPSELLMD
ncbi:MAG: hypothetical protein H8E25_05555 [Planctomycetes bacterium]|jgi:hypothetical protein|nr:hypothetical protein [Planctomycetota bacterium]